MQNHTKIYLDFYQFDPSSFIPCMVCGARAVDIHHIIPRSKFGKKRKAEQDKITNLIGLCRPHHDDAHAERISKEDLQLIVKTAIRIRQDNKNPSK